MGYSGIPTVKNYMFDISKPTKENAGYSNSRGLLVAKDRRF
jgi:hypothetical protein